MTSREVAVSRAAILSIVISFVVLALKSKAYIDTRSVAVLSDAIETIVNVVTAFIAFFAVKIAAAPADENHPYGHGKMENFSAAFEGGLIFFASGAVIFQAIESFYVGPQFKQLNSGLTYLGVATLINFLAGLHLFFKGQKRKSEALKASGKHLLSDVITSIGVIIGLYMAHYTGWLWLDGVIGLILGCWLGYESYKIVRESSGALLDETDDKAVVKLAEIIQKHKTKSIIDIHNLRMIRSGHFHHIDAHMVVPQFWDIEMAHDVAHEFEAKVVKDYEFDGEFAFHIDPCQKRYCDSCEIENCKIRLAPFKSLRPMTFNHIVKGPQHYLVETK